MTNVHDMTNLDQAIWIDYFRRTFFKRGEQQTGTKRDTVYAARSVSYDTKEN